MAKKSTITPTTTTTETVTAEYDLMIDRDSIPAASILYLLTYGARRSCQDATAGKAKEAREAFASNDHDAMKKWHDSFGIDPNEHATAESYGEAIERAFYVRRWESIMAGNPPAIGGPSGPRLRGIDAIIRDVAVDWLKAAAAKAGKKLPTGDDYKALLGRFMEANGPALRAEAERRQQADNVTIDF